MPEAYSLDLRELVARFVEGGRSCRAAAALFSVSVAFVVRLMKSFRATGSSPPSRAADAATPSLIRIGRFCSAASPKKPTLQCRNSQLNSPQPAALRLIPPHCRAGSSATAIASKKTLLASEQDRPDIKAAREEWTTKRQPRMRLEPHRLVFLDETGTTTKN